MRDLVRSIRRTKKYVRQSELAWRYVLNLRPTLEYRVRSRTLSAEATPVVTALDRDGVAVSSVADLRLDGSFADLEQAVARLTSQRQQELEAARRACREQNSSKQKPFLFSLLGDHPKLDSGSPLVLFALQSPIPEIARAYFGMSVVLRYCNVWHNFVTDAPASQSQYWHRDPEDRYILKVFVCLSNVDAGSGPFAYARGSHMKSGVTVNPPHLHKDGETPRSDDAQMAKVIPPERWLCGTGSKGTMIFADTRGFHKGGLARERERVLYVCEFTSPSAGDGGILCRPINS